MRIPKPCLLSLFWLLILFPAHSQSPPNQSSDCGCQQLARHQFPNATVTVAECVPSGSFSPPGSPQTFKDLPAFCRIAATLKPTPQSTIRIEVWLPQSGWNGRFLGTGNGGGAGSIAYSPLANGLKRGFATANTDMGTSPNAAEAVGQPERWVDFGHRATHEMTVVGKSITRAYYRKAIDYAYFAGCSTGGQQALMEAQRYPEDYDGILAGAPANNRTHLHTGFVWNAKVANEQPGGVMIAPEKIKLITDAVVKACAGKDGGAPGDSFLTDPRACPFDPQTLPRCPTGTNNKTCLTDAERNVLQKIYAGPVNPRTDERIYTPLPLGSENSASGIDFQQNASKAPASLFYLYRWVFGPSFQFSDFDFDRDQARLDSILAPVLNANQVDLQPLKKRGGKLLMYAGTADPLVPFQDALHYYDRVVQAQGGLSRTQSFFRFFLIPGMAHCGGGPGLNDCGQSLALNGPTDRDHDILTALMQWVENGKAPDQLIATAYPEANPTKGIRFQRPIYPYPKWPAYTQGDPASPASYRGVKRPQGQVLVPADTYLK